MKNGFVSSSRRQRALSATIVLIMTRHRRSAQEAKPARTTPRPRAAGPVNLRQEVRSLLVIAAPLAAAYLAEIAMMITDMVIVGRLGSVQLAAVGLAGDLMIEIMLFGMAIVSIVGVLVAQASAPATRPPAPTTFVRASGWRRRFRCRACCCAGT